MICVRFLTRRPPFTGHRDFARKAMHGRANSFEPKLAFVIGVPSKHRSTSALHLPPACDIQEQEVSVLPPSTKCKFGNTTAAVQ